MVPCDICCSCQHLPRQHSGWGSCRVYWPECPSASGENSVSHLLHCLHTLPATRDDECWVKRAEQIQLCSHSSCSTTEHMWILVTWPMSGSAMLHDQRIMVQFPVETQTFLLLYPAAYRGSFLGGGQQPGVWNWPLMSISPQDKERFELHLHILIRLSSLHDTSSTLIYTWWGSI